LFFPALKACFYKQEKTDKPLPEAKRTFLVVVNPLGSPSELGEDGNPIFDSFHFLL
jgi:hypothetical protein